jgi:flavin reductase (DIM6/NTAB) family NADH-FMN oxidoreductase RutF
MKSVKTQLKKFQYFYPYTVALVGARAGDRMNFMSCAWHTALSFEPPLFGVLIARKRLTHEVISAAREFSVNFLSFDRVRLSAQMGRKSGHEMDKIKEFGVGLQPAKVIKSPLIEDAYVAHHDAEAFNSEGVLNPMKVHPLLYLGSDFYLTIDPDTLKHIVPD